VNVDLSTQIRDYAHAVDGEQEPLTFNAITEIRLRAEPVKPVALQRKPANRRPPRRWIVAVTAAAVVVLIVGGAALLVRVSGQGSPLPTVPAADTFTPTIDPLSSYSWSRVARNEVSFGGEAGGAMSSVTVGGPGLVAVGVDSTGPAVWTSADGITWSRVPPDEAVFGALDEQSMADVTVGGPGLVAVGRDESGLDGDAAVWTSPDGVIWSRVPHDEAVFGGEREQHMSGVTVGGPGLVAVGADHATGPAVWTSPDGVTWSRVPPDDAVFSGERDQWMTDVTVGGPGLVAVGSGDGVSTRPAVWTSPDGITWTWVPHNDAFAGRTGGYPGMNSVTAGGPGLVAVGSIDFHAAVWTSADGVTWSRVPHDDAVFGLEGSEMESVTVGGPGLVAVGSSGSGGDVDAAVWTSADGVGWSRVPNDEPVLGLGASVNARPDTSDFAPEGMQSVTASPFGLIAVGLDWSDDLLPEDLRPDAAVWVGVPEE